jgi:hypothetical protein
MPIFSQITFTINEDKIETAISLQEILYKNLNIGKFIIITNSNDIIFEIINIKYSKISFKYLLNENTENNHLPFGINISKNIVFFDLDNEKVLTIYGKLGSGFNIAISSLILSFCYFNSPSTSSIKFINPIEENLYIYENFKKILHVDKECLITNEKIVDYLKKLMIQKDCDKKTIIIFENFDKFCGYSIPNRDLFIDFLKFIKNTKSLYLILATNEVNSNSAGDDIYSLLDSKIVFKLSTVKESVSLLKTPAASLLYGSGDGYLLNSINQKNRVQTCYIGKVEVNYTIDIINTFYQANEHNNEEKG